MNIAIFDIIDQWHAGTLKSVLTESKLKPILDNFSYSYGHVEANYIPCITPVGHATLSTGENPKGHQIIGRTWWTTESGARTEVSIEELFDLLFYGIPSGYTFPKKIRDNNLCHSCEDWFSIVVAAKDFVPLILGGNDADIQIYPSIGTRGWELDIRCRDKTIVDQNIRNEIIHLLNHIGIKAKYSMWDPARRCHLFNLINFNLSSMRPIDVDGFYSECVKVFLRKASEIGVYRALSCQSFYSTDWVGHEVGPGNGKYIDTLLRVFELIADKINFADVLSRHKKLIGLITTDHGSRKVDSIIKIEGSQRARSEYFEFNSGPMKIGNDEALFQSTSTSSPDVLYWYYVGDDKDVNRHGFKKINNNRFDIKKGILIESFQSHNQPDIIEVADSNKYFYPDIFGDVWSGSHGASIRDSQRPEDLNPDDFTIPYLIFRSRRLLGQVNLLNDSGLKWPNYHRQLRELFLSLLKGCDNLQITLFPQTKDDNRDSIMPDLPKMLSLHGLSQQCQLIEKVYRRVAEEIRKEPSLLDYLRNYIALELEKEELSVASKLLLMLVKTGVTYPKHDDIPQIIKQPFAFEQALGDDEKTIKNSLERYAKIYQILPEIRALRSTLEESKSANEAAEAFELTAQKLREKAIEIEKLLA